MTATQKRARRIAGGLALGILLPLALFSMIEFLVVTTGSAPPEQDPLVLWNPHRDQELTESKGEFRFSRQWLWEPRPGAMVYGAPINRGGYRGPYYPEERSDRLRIAVMGDSSTYATKLSEDASFARVLETALRERDCSVEVLNFGVIGFTIAQGLRLYEGRVRTYRPDIVIAAFGAVNDQHLTLADLVDEKKLTRISRLRYRIREFLQRYASIRLLNQLRAGESDGQHEIEQDQLASRVPLADFERCLRDLHRAVLADGGQLVLVSPPRRFDGEARFPRTLEYTEALLRLARELDLPLADVRESFRAGDLEALGPDLLEQPHLGVESTLFIDPWHPSPAGHRRYAVVIGRALERAGLLPGVR